jgi:Single cache domain 3
VDAVKDVTGASITIFLGDTRIATNIRNPDGSRAMGTKLAPTPLMMRRCATGTATAAPRRFRARPILASTSRSGILRRKRSVSCLSVCRSLTRKPSWAG